MPPPDLSPYWSAELDLGMHLLCIRHCSGHLKVNEAHPAIASRELEGKELGEHGCTQDLFLKLLKTVVLSAGKQQHGTQCCRGSQGRLPQVRD